MHKLDNKDIKDKFIVNGKNFALRQADPEQPVAFPFRQKVSPHPLFCWQERWEARLSPKSQLHQAEMPKKIPTQT